MRDLVTGRHRPDGSSQRGAWTSGTPRFMRIRQGPVSMNRWWAQQSSTPLSVCVGPPLAWSVTWCASHQPAGTWQPGMMQPPSRSANARRWCRLKRRSSVPSRTIRPFAGEGDPLDHPGAPDVAGDGWGDGLVAAFDGGPSGVGGEVFGAAHHDQRRRGPADRGQVAAARGDAEGEGERVVQPLRPGAVVQDRREPCGLVVFGLVVRLVVRVAGELDAGRAGVGGVADPLQLGGDVGEQVAADRDDSVAGVPEGESAAARDVAFVGFGAVLVERGRPHLGVHAQHIRAGRRLGIRSLPARVARRSPRPRGAPAPGRPAGPSPAAAPRPRAPRRHRHAPSSSAARRAGSRAGRSSPVSMSHVGATARCARSSRAAVCAEQRVSRWMSSLRLWQPSRVVSRSSVARDDERSASSATPSISTPSTSRAMSPAIAIAAASSASDA